MMLGSDCNHAHLNTSFRAGEMAAEPAKMLVAKPGFVEGVLKSILRPVALHTTNQSINHLFINSDNKD